LLLFLVVLTASRDVLAAFLLPAAAETAVLWLRPAVDEALPADRAATARDDLPDCLPAAFTEALPVRAEATLPPAPWEGFWASASSACTLPVSSNALTSTFDIQEKPPARTIILPATTRNQ
jgi:hypothetical protein